MKVILKSKVNFPVLTHKDIKPNEVYICTCSPNGKYDGWTLMGVQYLNRIGIWIGKGSAIYSLDTFDYKDFEFKKIEANLVEV